MIKITRLLLAAATCLWLIQVHAEIIENDPRFKISTIEPARDVGYTVGDKLSRTILLEAPNGYELLPTSLPVPDNQKKRQNKEQGIELSNISYEKQRGLSGNIFVLHLTYQVFTNRIVARPAALPPEYVKFGGRGENVTLRIPSWSFRISPLAVYGSVVIEKDMSGFRGPLLLDAGRHRQILWGLLAVLGCSLLGLFYILGTSTWLPRMGRPFARACRDLKKLPATPQGLSQAVARVHEAINVTAGRSVFDRAALLEHKPAFAPVSAELERFFALSRTVFFEPDAPHGIEGEPLAWLRQFCRRCRDCERGMK